MSGSTRFIAHLDMDAFYASVELIRYPELRGRPVVIGGGRRHQPQAVADPVTGALVRTYATLRDYVGRGVATTATYEARAFGVRAGIGLMKAGQLAPDAILLPVDMDEYRRHSRMFKAAVRAITPLVEDRGIDEIYIDLTAVVASAPQPWSRAREVAAGLKDAVRSATGLACSIGVTPNKLLSKIASDLDKPDGLTLLRTDDIPARIWPLPVRRINGIGPKAGARLEVLGIRSIGELAAAEPHWLIENFGRAFGAWMHAAANGRDERPVVTESEPRSISRETTFERDLHAVRDRASLTGIFTDLCERVAGDLQRKGYAARTIGLKLRYDDFRTVTRDQSLERPTNDPATIRRMAGLCLKRVDLSRRIRLLGVRAGTLSRAEPANTEGNVLREPPATLPLFD